VAATERATDPAVTPAARRSAATVRIHFVEPPPWLIPVPAEPSAPPTARHQPRHGNAWQAVTAQLTRLGTGLLPLREAGTP
jgi:hypothetical protein